MLVTDRISRKFRKNFDFSKKGGTVDGTCIFIMGLFPMGSRQRPTKDKRDQGNGGRPTGERNTGNGKPLDRAKRLA